MPALLEGGTVVGWGWNAYGQLGLGGKGAAGTKFTCFTGNKVQILTPEELLPQGRGRATRRRRPVYLLY